ncbi:MAG TPA: MGMT family protein [Nitrososphaera sp.]|nr:MGMT family protein [Nitrososphaera sp.]
MQKQLKAEDVYEILARIPEGRVTTYGDIARALGHPTASRAVGRILNKNPNPVVVPCHRVVMSDGNIGGYAFGKAKKKELLKKEGVRFMGDGMHDFAGCRADVAKLC